MTLISPSILSADFARLGEEIADLAQGGADWIHVDVMDGRFVPNITIGPPVVRALHRVTNLPLDVHLMIVEPEKYIEAFHEAGANILTVHAEATPHLHRNLQQIKALKMKAGVSLNPATPLSMIEHVLEEVDMVLVMSVNPGFGGQEFIPSALGKITELARLRSERNLDFLIEVDGGINEVTGAKAVMAGADVLVAGNFVFKETPYEKTILKLRQATARA